MRRTFMVSVLVVMFISLLVLGAAPAIAAAKEVTVSTQASWGNNVLN